MAIQRREKHNMRSILGVFASAKKLAKFSGPNFDGYSTSKGNNKEEVSALHSITLFYLLLYHACRL
jgi:hypothetical protein